MRSAYVLAFAAVTLAGCNKGGGAGASGAAPATGAAGTPAANACSGYTAGSNGVIRTFCDGPGVLTIVLGGASHTLRGGACDATGPMYSFNVGVVTGMGAHEPYPDYVGLTSPKPGPFQNAVIAIHLDGKAYRVTSNTGAADVKGGTFTGTAHPVAGGPDVQVYGSFTC